MSCSCDDVKLWTGSSAHLAFKLAVEGVPTDPSSITLTVTDANGHITTPGLTRSGVGAFHADIDLETAGQWWYRIASVSPRSAREGSFDVRASRVP